MSDTDGSAYDSRAGLPASRPPRPAASGHLVGRVADSTTRVESHGRDFGSHTVLSFRLLGSDGQSPRDVLLRGRSISGTVRDGDWVEVSERGQAGRLEVNAVRNLTTGAEVEASSGSSNSLAARAIRVILMVVFVVVLLFIVWGVLDVFEVLDGWRGDGGLVDGGEVDPVDPGFDSPGS